MGLSHSSDEPAEGLEENHTPPTNRRVQKLVDPRSPTDDVQRTPMQRSVNDDNDFEDPRSLTSRIARTPVPDDSDPRSPTAGREPGTGPFVFPVPEDPRSPTINVARTPICKDAPKDAPFETVTVHQEESSQSTGNNQESNGENTQTLSAENTESETDKTNDSPAGGDTDKCENEHKSENTPEYEMKLSELMEKQAIASEEAANEDHTILSDRELVFLTELPPSPATSSTSVLTSSSKSLTTAKPKSGHNSLNLKGKIHTLSASTMTTTAARSPLSTRNLLQDSPDPAYQRSRTAPKVGVAYGKAGIRRRLMADDGDAGINGKARARVDVGRTVGRYYPVEDKENY